MLHSWNQETDELVGVKNFIKILQRRDTHQKRLSKPQYVINANMTRLRICRKERTARLQTGLKCDWMNFLCHIRKHFERFSNEFHHNISL